MGRLGHCVALLFAHCVVERGAITPKYRPRGKIVRSLDHLLRRWSRVDEKQATAQFLNLVFQYLLLLVEMLIIGRRMAAKVRRPGARAVSTGAVLTGPGQVRWA